MARTFLQGTEYLEVASGLGNPTDLTLACWCNPDSGAPSGGLLVLGTDGSNDHRRGIHFNGSGISAQSRSTSNGIATSGAGPGATVWQHAAGVFTGTTSRFSYVDGVPGSEDTTSISPSAPDIVGVAEINGSGSTRFNGSIAEAAVYNVALTTTEIEALAAGASPLLVRPTALILYSPFWRDEDTDLIGSLSYSTTGTPTVSPHPPIHYGHRAQVGITAAVATQGGFFTPLPGPLGLMGSVPGGGFQTEWAIGSNVVLQPGVSG